MKIPQYYTNRDYSVNHLVSAKAGIQPFTELVLPQHSFVKPFWNPLFIPKAVADHYGKNYVGLKDCVFCYTAFGVIPLPKDLIEEAYD